MKIVSIGEVLWDVIGYKEHLSGGPFSFSAHARMLGHRVYFISALGYDEGGNRLLKRMVQMGLSTRFFRRVKGYAIGNAPVGLNTEGQPESFIHRPATFDFPILRENDLTERVSPGPDWNCFSTLPQISAQAREITRRLLPAKCGVRSLFDINLQLDCYERELMEDLMS